MAEALLTFADKMKREELIREYEEAIALDMYQDMTSYIEHCCGDLQRVNRDYYLMKVFNAIKAEAQMQAETKLGLRGYEIVVDTPMNSAIRFGMGNFWIGGKLIVIKYKEEAENYIVHFINNVLPGGLTIWREKMAKVDKDLLKRIKLRNMMENNGSDMVTAAFSGMELEHKLKFENSKIELLVYRKGKYLTYGDLRYETFTEDLRAFMDGKLRQYINA